MSKITNDGLTRSGTG